jgi:hypothetical protein
MGDFMKLTSQLLGGKQVQTHPAKGGDGGLDGVLKGLDRLRRGHVSGVKLVLYTVVCFLFMTLFCLLFRPFVHVRHEWS